MKKLFKAIGLILLVAVLFVSFLFVNGTCFSKYSNTDKNIKWMENIKDDVLISDVVLPGSHDAGSYDMIYLTETQNFSIKNQLELGSRYFDIRVNFVDGEYKIFHDIINGVDFLPILLDIQQFIKQNDTEVLLLDFQHFKNNSQDGVLSMINQYLYNENLCISNVSETLTDLDYISSLKLGDARGKCIIFWGDDSSVAPYLFSRNNDECSKTNMSLNSCYYSFFNEKSSKDYINEGLPTYFNNIKDKIKNEKHKGIFVLQCQLTDGYKIFGPYSKEKTHDEKITAYLSSLENDENSELLSLLNVVMRDFLNEKKVDNIIRLNIKKGNVRNNCLDEFIENYN